MKESVPEGPLDQASESLKNGIHTLTTHSYDIAVIVVISTGHLG